MLMSSQPTVSDLAAYRRQRALLQRVSRQEDIPDGVMPKIIFLLKLVQSLKTSIPASYRKQLTVIELLLEGIGENLTEEEEELNCSNAEDINSLLQSLLIPQP